MFYEYLPISPFDFLGLLGVLVFFGVQVLFSRRIIGGDGLAFFAGNTVAAALVLASNLDGLYLPLFLAQIILIVLAMLMMIARFFDGAERS